MLLPNTNLRKKQIVAEAYSFKNQSINQMND
jgi:hypothetical protein